MIYILEFMIHMIRNIKKCTIFFTAPDSLAPFINLKNSY